MRQELLREVKKLLDTDPHNLGQVDVDTRHGTIAYFKDLGDGSVSVTVCKDDDEFERAVDGTLDTDESDIETLADRIADVFYTFSIGTFSASV